MNKNCDLPIQAAPMLCDAPAHFPAVHPPPKPACATYRICSWRTHATRLTSPSYFSSVRLSDSCLTYLIQDSPMLCDQSCRATPDQSMPVRLSGSHQSRSRLRDNSIPYRPLRFCATCRIASIPLPPKRQLNSLPSLALLCDNPRPCASIRSATFFSSCEPERK